MTDAVGNLLLPVHSCRLSPEENYGTTILTVPIYNLTSPNNENGSLLFKSTRHQRKTIKPPFQSLATLQDDSVA